MHKISKRDQDPHQIHEDQEGINRLLSKKCMHFAMGTDVLCNNVRGTIVGFSQDGGRYLLIRWEDGGYDTMPNPNYPIGRR